MEEVNNADSHMISPAAFVEGGVQDACDDSCSICLESFDESDPSTVTTCKHEFHLQCILEWCQRSTNCPMCWQTITLKDPSSQELLDAVEQERRFRSTPARNAAIFYHPTLGDFELQHLPAGMNDADLEDRIIQHLAAAATMGRTRHIARRESTRSRPSAHGRSHFVVFSTHADAPASASIAPVVAEHEPDVLVPANLSLTRRAFGSESSEHSPQFSSVQGDRLYASSSGSIIMTTNPHEVPIANRSSARHSPVSRDGAGPSDFQSISESWKTRWNTMSMKYKESISKSTRGWKEKLFSRNTSMAEIGSEVRREVDAGIASVSRMMERLETRENSRVGGPLSASNDTAGTSFPQESNHDNMDIRHGTPQNDTLPLAATSVSRQVVGRMHTVTSSSALHLRR